MFLSKQCPLQGRTAEPLQGQVIFKLKRNVKEPSLLKWKSPSMLKLVPVHRVQVTPNKAHRPLSPRSVLNRPEKLHRIPFDDLIPNCTFSVPALHLEKPLSFCREPHAKSQFKCTTNRPLQPHCKTVPWPDLLLKQLPWKALETYGTNMQPKLTRLTWRWSPLPGSR